MASNTCTGNKEWVSNTFVEEITGGELSRVRGTKSG